MKNIFFGPVGTSFQEWGVRSLQNIERWINTLTEFRGATALRDGADGLVPQPKIGDQTKFLSGDGTFKTVPGGGGGSGTGDVTGPASSTDNAVARYDGTTGKIIQSSLTTISDAGTLATPIVTVNDDVYSGSWDGSTAVPTKNAVYDKIQTLGAGGGGNVSNVGTPVDNQIAVWSSATTIDGSANFTFNSATGGFVMTGQMIFFVLPTTSLAQSLRSVDAGAVGPGQEFFHNSPSPAVDDAVGYIDFWGRNAAAALANYGKLTVTIADPVAGTEDGAINCYVLKAGTLTNISVLNANGLTVFGNVFVTDEAYGPTWDGSTAVPTKNAIYDKIQTLGSGGGGTGDVVGPGSATDNALVRFDTATGKLIQNSVATLSDTGTLATAIVTVTDDAYAGTWDGSTQVPTKNAVYDKIQTLSAGGGGNVSNAGTPVNNQIAIWTTSTNIEGDANYTYDSATNILALTGTQIITRTTFGTNFSLRSTDPGANGPVVEFYHNSASPAVGDVVAATYYYGNNSAAASKSYGVMTVSIVDPVAATEDGIIRWYAMKAGTVTNVAAFDGAGLTSFFDVFTTDEAYGATWDGSFAVPTKNAVYDKIQTMGGGGFTAATQAEQEAASSVTVGVTPGRQQFHPTACKAWITFTTITTTVNNASFNVASFTDNGTGDTTITFTVAFSSANYAVTATGGADSSALAGRTISIRQNTPPTASTVRMLNVRPDTNVAQDNSNQSISCFGDQ